MKRYAALLLTAALVTSLTACNWDKNMDSSSSGELSSSSGSGMERSMPMNGEQLLDPAYLHEAEKNQYPVNAPKHGYGYFFWTNPDDESYRADGMYGQYIVVVPKSKVVVTVQALDSKKFFDDVWSELVVPFLNKG